MLIATFRLLAVWACHFLMGIECHRPARLGQRARTTLSGGVHPRVYASASNVMSTCRPARASREDTFKRHPRPAVPSSSNPAASPGWAWLDNTITPPSGWASRIPSSVDVGGMRTPVTRIVGSYQRGILCDDDRDSIADVAPRPFSIVRDHRSRSLPEAVHVEFSYCRPAEPGPPMGRTADMRAG